MKWRVIDMTIDEAIENLKYDIEIDMYIRGIAPQIAKWLEELKELREKNETLKALYEGVRKEGNNLLKRERNKAIDDLIAECENAKFAESDEISLSDVHTGVNSGLSMAIHFAEQLKAGGENERSI